MANCNCCRGLDFAAERPVPEELKQIFSNYPTQSREYLIPLLQDVQEKYGYLSEDNLILISEHLNIPASKVFGTATFYNQFRLTPIGKHVIRVCRGTACHVKNSAQILAALEAELGIKAGETTKDKLFTLETVACIGACSIAPVMVIDDTFYGRLTPKEVQAVLKKVQQAEKQ